jgi:hypothetical protein
VFLAPKWQDKGIMRANHQKLRGLKDFVLEVARTDCFQSQTAGYVVSVD